jgi:hypothetical protein
MNKSESMPQEENGQLLMASIINPEEKKKEENITEPQKIQFEERVDPWLDLGNPSPERIEELRKINKKKF